MNIVVSFLEDAALRVKAKDYVRYSLECNILDTFHVYACVSIKISYLYIG